MTSAVPPSGSPPPPPGQPQSDPTRPLQADKSLGDLFGDLSEQFSGLLRDEVELAKVELKAEARSAAKAGGFVAAAGVVGLLSLVLLSFAVAWGLAELIPAGLAFAVVGVVYAGAAAALGVVGKSKLQDLNPRPEQTIETVKEDVQWAKKQLS